MEIIKDIKDLSLILTCANFNDKDDGPGCGGPITH